MVGYHRSRLGIATAALLISVGCSLGPLSSMPKAVMIQVHGNALTLAWDPPALVADSLPSRVVAYYLYYRELSSSQWVLLAEIPAVQSVQYTVMHERLGDGMFVFGVRSLCANEDLSAMHSSLDWNANPIAGWYIWWMKNE
jgi:hypothetical protein